MEKNIYLMLLFTLPPAPDPGKHRGSREAPADSLWLLPELITFHKFFFLADAAPDLPFVPFSLWMKV